MTFEAYLSNIRKKTGKDPRDFFDEAVRGGVLRPETKAMEFVAWLKADSGLGHGHAMAVWEAFKRNAWVPLPHDSGSSRRRAASTSGKAAR